MLLRQSVITWVMVWIFWIGPRLVVSAPTPISTSDVTSTSTSTSRNSGPTYNPYPYANGAGDSSPATTVIIVGIVGGLAFLGAAWGLYCCLVARKQPKIATVAGGRFGEPTTMIYIPGENPPMAALPSLRYNAPPAVHQPSSPMEVGPGAILPPPPAYDVATAGRPLPTMDGNAPSLDRPKRERTESMWKDLLVSQGRD